MKTKILIAVLAIGLFTTSKALAQEKEQAKMDMKMDHSKMDMKHDSMKMKMDSTKMNHSKMGMNHDQMAKTYVCPMHADVSSEKPGKCPKCSMTMVEKKTDAKMDMKKAEDTPENKSDLKKHKH